MLSACSCGRGKLGYQQHGDPYETLSFFPSEELTADAGQVVIRVIASPINRIDLAQIEGKYPIENKSVPHIAGNDGVGKVISVGEGVTNLKKGDYVIPLVHGMGWWRLKLKAKAEEVYPVPKDIDLYAACMLSSIYCTAYRLVKDFGLKSKDSVIHNGANSSVGQIITQLCKQNNITSINIVRDRMDMQETEEYLQGLGGDYVMTDLELPETCIFSCDNIPKPKVGFNSIGGVSGLSLMKNALDDNSLLVTYGEASGRPLLADVSSLIYKNIKVSGFWMDKWHRDHLGKPEQKEMLDDLIKMIKDGKLKPPKKVVIKYDCYSDAIADLQEKDGRVGHKYILDIGNVEEYEAEKPQSKPDGKECTKPNCEKAGEKGKENETIVPKNVGEVGEAVKKN